MVTSLELGLDLSEAAHNRLHTAYADHVLPNQLERETIEHLDFLMQEIVPLRVVPNLEQLDARWHPSEFLVFSLGEARNPGTLDNCGKLGTRRLHIWPRGLRQREVRGLGKMPNGEWDGDIHNHAWNVTSYVMKGYADRIDEAHELGTGYTQEEVVAHGLFRRYRPWYNADGTEALINTGHCVSTSPREYRDVESKEIHTIDPWVYHIPLIPEDKFAATLVVNSHRILEPEFPDCYWEEEVFDGNEMWGLPDILIRGATEPIVGARRIATLGEKVLAKVQLLETLSEQPYDFEQPLRGVLAAAYKQLADVDTPRVR